MKALRRWSARLLLGCALLTAAHGAYAALRQSRSTFRYARRLAVESLEVAQDRVFGRAYMEAIRAARRAFRPGDTVYFIDDAKRQDGSTYFANYFLAPRRLKRYGNLEQLAVRRFQVWLPKGVTTLVVVPSGGEPVRLIPSTGLRTGRQRVRKDRR